jgi:hypothetical protein
MKVKISRSIDLERHHSALITSFIGELKGVFEEHCSPDIILPFSQDWHIGPSYRI